MPASSFADTYIHSSLSGAYRIGWIERRALFMDKRLIQAGRGATSLFFTRDRQPCKYTSFAYDNNDVRSAEDVSGSYAGDDRRTGQPAENDACDDAPPFRVYVLQYAGRPCSLLADEHDPDVNGTGHSAQNARAKRIASPFYKAKRPGKLSPASCRKSHLLECLMCCYKLLNPLHLLYKTHLTIYFSKV